MKLSVIIVSYNVSGFLEQCIDSVLKSSQGLDTEVWVVDNHSHDDSVEMVRRVYPQVHLIVLQHNLGFARANNKAIRQSCGEYVLLLNPDTVVTEDALQTLVNFMDSHPKAGGCGLRMSNTDGSDAKESRRGLPTPITAFYKMSGLCSRFPHHPKFGHYYMGDLSWDEPGRIEVISGACFMLRRSALDNIGLLDEDFFMYGEDIDLSYRLLKGGFENWYVPARILHYKGESTEKSSFRYVHVFYEAMLIFFRKHYGGMSLFLSIPIKAAILFKATIAFFGMQIHRMRKSLGFVDRPKQHSPHYFFIGAEEHQADMRRIAIDNGLDAEFVTGTSQTLPEGHLGLKYTEYKNVMVYDTSVYTYQRIISLFASRPVNNVYMGFYHPDKHFVVTTITVFR